MYDGGGNRVKKLSRASGGSWETITYIDGLIEYREDNIGNRQSISHIMDDKKRIATVREGFDFSDLTPAVKFNLDDHLGSSNVLLDDLNGTPISAEEYYPFGETSFGSYDKKRYRYCGKEKDDESGLYYYGARYYSAWTCKFTSIDPLAAKYAQLTPYNYAANNPIGDKDIDGMQTQNTQGTGVENQMQNPTLQRDKPATNTQALHQIDVQQNLHKNQAELFAELSGGKIQASSVTDELGRHSYFVDVSMTPYGMQGVNTVYTFEPGKNYSHYFGSSGGSEQALALAIPLGGVNPAFLFLAGALLIWIAFHPPATTLQIPKDDTKAPPRVAPITTDDAIPRERTMPTYKYYRAMSYSELYSTKGYLADLKTSGEGPHITANLAYLTSPDAFVQRIDKPYDVIVEYISTLPPILLEGTPHVFLAGDPNSGEVLNAARQSGTWYKKIEGGLGTSYGFPGFSTTMFNLSLVSPPKPIHMFKK